VTRAAPGVPGHGYARGVSGERALPERPSLRYLKLEAKQRHAAGEFPTLHDAQLAIAREHGRPGWAALREAVDAAVAAAAGEGHALARLRWIIARFRGAGEPGWLAPDEEELREHFTATFLTAVPPDRLFAVIAEMGPALRAELTVGADRPFLAEGVLAGHLVMAETEPRPPYRLTGVRARRLGERVSDQRAAAPATAPVGPVPAAVPGLAGNAVRQLGLAALALAGASAAGEAWATATGWASLERGEPLRAGHVFPAYQVTMTVTAVAVLCLAAAGRLRLDDPANSYLTAIRLTDEAVTVRELLTHTAGVTDRPTQIAARAVPPLETVTGPAFACTGRRGTVGLSHAGYAALGEIIAGRAGFPYPEAVSRLVLRPLGMSQSRFPAGEPDGAAPGPSPQAGYQAVTSYDVAGDGTFTPLDRVVCVLPAAGGLWTTAADLARFGLGWASLLPRPLAAQALRPHARLPNGAYRGLGWIVNEPAGLAGFAGEGPGAAASLLFSLDGGHACAALSSRQIIIEQVNAAVHELLSGASIRLH
jgi:CubicO group peptidase (beta-lactamase class C family)